MNLTSFGSSTAVLLLTSDLITTLTQSFIHVSFCRWILIIGAILTPITFQGSPQDFKAAGVLATLGTSVGTLLLFVNILIEFKTGSHHPKYTNPTFNSYFSSFGIILFAYGGAAVFPTFQNDMKHKQQFSIAVFYAMIGTIIKIYFYNHLKFEFANILQLLYYAIYQSHQLGMEFLVLMYLQTSLTASIKVQ